ncbi:MAG: hypothetical protein KDA81_08520 [Planctomycetaceae bacterium]|nr:hypothetical protein [Planctomycetaceae bacterium]
MILGSVAGLAVVGAAIMFLPGLLNSGGESVTTSGSSAVPETISSGDGEQPVDAQAAAPSGSEASASTSTTAAVQPAVTEQPTTTEATQAAASPERPQVDLSGVVPEAQQALSLMLQTLDAGDTKTFLDRFVPIKIFYQYQAATKEGKPIPKFPDQLIALLKDRIQKMQSMHGEPGWDGNSVQFLSEQDLTADGERPTTGNFFAEISSVAEQPGYGDQLANVLQAAIADLSAGRSEEFALKMFPPTAVAMMKAEGRWEAAVAQLNAGSKQSTLMQQDLARLASMTPSIQGNTATFTMERLVTSFADRRQPPVQVPDGTREIRFSLIDGHWRFYDNASQLHRQMAQAFEQEMPRLKSTDADQYALEKIDGQWRLKSLPPRPRP